MPFPPKPKQACPMCRGGKPCYEHGGKVEKPEGMSPQGERVRMANDREEMESTTRFGHRSKVMMDSAKEEAKERAESEKMIKPKMQGLAEGGEVEAPHDDDMEDELHGMLADELHQALESKDKKAILESIRALVLSCKE